MASKNAENVAREVIQEVRKGHKISVSKLARKVGYSENYSKQPSRITKQEGYKKVIEPILNRLIALRDRAIAEVSNRQLDYVQYKELISSIDLLTKNIQLIGGGSTERMAIVLPSEIVDKNGLVKPSSKE